MATRRINDGETLSGIARSLGMSVEQLLALNPQIANPNLIFAGQDLNVSSSQAQPQSTSMTDSDLVKQLADTIQAKKSLQDVLPFEVYFDSNLAREGVDQQTQRYFEPQIENALQNNLEDFSNRGMLRSGIRGKAESDIIETKANEQQTMGEQLYNTRKQQAAEAYANLQKTYEADPTSYKGETYKLPTIENKIETPLQKTYASKYGVGRTTGSPYTYSQGYKQYVTSKFKPLNQF
jgi:hypothetical protein